MGRARVLRGISLSTVEKDGAMILLDGYFYPFICFCGFSLLYLFGEFIVFFPCAFYYLSTICSYRKT